MGERSDRIISQRGRVDQITKMREFLHSRIATFSQKTLLKNPICRQKINSKNSNKSTRSKRLSAHTKQRWVTSSSPQDKSPQTGQLSQYPSLHRHKDGQSDPALRRQCDPQSPFPLLPCQTQRTVHPDGEQILP